MEKRTNTRGVSGGQQSRSNVLPAIGTVAKGPKYMSSHSSQIVRNAFADQLPIKPDPALISERHPIYKDNYGRLNMIGRKRSNRALIGFDSQ